MGYGGAIKKPPVPAAEHVGILRAEVAREVAVHGRQEGLAEGRSALEIRREALHVAQQDAVQREETPIGTLAGY